ncbi:hypothetical protein PXJ20_11970 [Paraburkholderia sp. A1RI_3L]|uniref:hypothetical protein n=1 Tax=Paraburkholderia TaxID=1822464 RepID=UPI003B7DAD77
MNLYCITAVKHDDPNNQVASKFKLWMFNDKDKTWNPQTTVVSKKAIVDLIQKGHKVITAQQEDNGIRRGEAVEIVLRVAKNDKNFPISEMPEF